MPDQLTGRELDAWLAEHDHTRGPMARTLVFILTLFCAPTKGTP
jgi:hypothetical protein